MKRDTSVPKFPYRCKEKYIVDEDTGCWVWYGAVASRGGGYGYLRVGKRTVRAHRYFYAKEFGPIEDGLVLHHVCNNSRCVNPDHMEVTTQEENIAAAGYCKLRPSYTHIIREMLAQGKSHKYIAAYFKCSPSAVSRFAKRWGIRQ